MPSSSLNQARMPACQAQARPTYSHVTILFCWMESKLHYKCLVPPRTPHKSKAQVAQSFPCPWIIRAKMDSRALATSSLFLLFNLLFFTMVSSTYVTCPPSPKPHPKPHHKHNKCPKNTLKLGVCAKVLNLVNVVVGSPETLPCCSFIEGLVDLEAALCLCTAIKANVLGLNLNVPVSLSLLLNVCGKKTPEGFKCF